MNTTKKLSLTAAALLLSLTACGGGGRPSESDLSKSITDGEFGKLTGAPKSMLTDDFAKCMAKVLEKSDLSDDALQALVDGDKDFKGSKDDTNALEGVLDEAMDCAG